MICFTHDNIHVTCIFLGASLVAQLIKNLPAMQETPGRFLGWEDPLEKGMATHSSILAWRIPWTEEHVYWELITSLVLIIQLLCHGLHIVRFLVWASAILKVPDSDTTGEIVSDITAGHF